jgi:hypothetical protein
MKHPKMGRMSKFLPLILSHINSPYTGQPCTLLFILLTFLATSLIVIADDPGSSTPDDVLGFGQSGHDDRIPAIQGDVKMGINFDPNAVKYQLSCGKSTNFCRAMPYQFHCNPDTGKASVRMSNLGCSFTCKCRPVLPGSSKSLESAFSAVQVSDTSADVVNTAIDAFSAAAPLSALQKRASKDWAFVCDSENITGDEQTEFTFNCGRPASGKYFCGSDGKIYNVYTPLYPFCEQYCRCVGMAVTCKLEPQKIKSWVRFCGVSGIPKGEVAGTPPSIPALPQRHPENDNVASTIPTMKCFGAFGLAEECSDHGYGCTRTGLAYFGFGSSMSRCEEECQCVGTTGSPPERGDLARQKISRREDAPALGPWEVWCGDIDSIHDLQMTDVCIFAWKYQCDDQGNLNSASETEACTVSCACIRQQLAHLKLRGLTGRNPEVSLDAVQPEARDLSNEANDPPCDITYDSPFSSGPWGSSANEAFVPRDVVNNPGDSNTVHDSEVVGRAPTTLVKRAKHAAQTD